MKVTKNSKKSPSSSRTPKSEPVKPAAVAAAPVEKPRLATTAIESPAAKTITPAVEKPESAAATAALKAAKKSAPIRKTIVEARIDVGFGNQLFIRGQGDGLSWEKGTPMECRDNSTWVWSTTNAKDKVEFKVLLNDQIWAQGDNLSVVPGESREMIPVF